MPLRRSPTPERRVQLARHARRARRGFTLVEMIAVLAIVGVLAAAARPLWQLSARRAQEHSLRQGLRSLREAIDAHKQAADAHLLKLPDGSSGYPASLQALVDGVPLADKPALRRYFLRRLPRDPFADPALPAAQTWALRASTSPPEAPLPGSDVFDVASRSERRALDGSTYRDW